MEPIILASSSPRRQEILNLLGIPFRVIVPNIDETITSTIDTDEVSEFIARQKVSAVLHSLPPKQEIFWILGADTIILKDGRYYGKPEDQDQAKEFLKELSGSTHTVMTSIILYNGRTKTTSARTAKTLVTLAEMTDEEIQWYLDTGEWHGAAGGYRIQSLASCFIKKIEGSQSCVTGLPIFELYDILKEQGYSILE
ncbi:MAG: septum formation protein Maf [Treponema sp.]|nr:septum formation protein Maf [Treponema sp.]